MHKEKLLAAAAGKGIRGVAEVLIETNCDINTRLDVESGYSTALILAIENGQPETALLLLDYGADANSIDSNGKNALIALCHMIGDGVNEMHYRDAMNVISSCEQIVDRLLTETSDINQKDAEGKTALMYAVKKHENPIEFVKKLVDHGADPAIVDKVGKNSVDHARQRDDWELSSYIEGVALDKSIRSEDDENPGMQF